MRNLLLLLLLTFAPLVAQNKTVKHTFDTFTTTGSSESINVQAGRSSVTYHTIEVDSNASTCTYTVEGTVSNDNWFDLSGTQSCTSDAMIHIVNRAVVNIRITVATFSGTNVVFHYLGVAE